MKSKLPLVAFLLVLGSGLLFAGCLLWAWQRLRAPAPVLTPAQRATNARRQAAYRDGAKPVRQGLLEYRLTKYWFRQTLDGLPRPAPDSTLLVLLVTLRNNGDTDVPMDETLFLLTDDREHTIRPSAPAEAALKQQANPALFATHCPPHALRVKYLAYVVSCKGPYLLYHLWLGPNATGWPPAYVNCYKLQRSKG